MKENHVMFKQSVFFDDNNELNDTGILLYVDALRLNRENELPAELVDHILNSPGDQKKIFEYYEFVKDDDIQELVPHPYFDKKSQRNTPVLGINKTQGLGIAAALLLTVGGGYLANKYLGSQQENADKVALSDSSKKTNTPPTTENKGTVEPIAQKKNTPPNTPTPKPKQVTPKKLEKAPNTPHPNLLENKELLAMSRITYYDKQIERLGNTRSSSIKVLTPTIDYKSNNVVFSWSNPVEDSLKLEVFTKSTDEVGRKVFMIAPKDSSFTLPTGFSPSLYYWELKQVLNNRREKRVGLGRFIIPN